MIAYEDNVEAMWPFPKFATQLIHVSERRYSVEGFRTAFLNASVRLDLSQAHIAAIALSVANNREADHALS